MYEYEISANEKEGGYSAFQPQAAAEEESSGCKQFDDGMKSPTMSEPSAEMIPAPTYGENPSTMTSVEAPVAAPVASPTTSTGTSSEPPDVEPTTNAPSSTSWALGIFGWKIASLRVLWLSATLFVAVVY